MAALTDIRLERYCQFRSVSGTPGGKSKDYAIKSAIYPETGTVEYQRFLNLIGNQNSIITTRFGELGGEVSP